MSALLAQYYGMSMNEAAAGAGEMFGGADEIDSGEFEMEGYVRRLLLNEVSALICVGVWVCVVGGDESVGLVL